MLARLLFSAAILQLLAIAPAQALTFYTDEAAWLAAVANDGIEPYPGTATITRNQVIEQLKPDGTCCLPPILSTSTGTTNFTSLSTRFSTVGIDDGFATPPLDKEIIINFSVPIDGFAVRNAEVSFTGQFNGGFGLPDAGFPGTALPFLGVVGDDITSLDFVSACVQCDENEFLIFSNIVVAVDEPPSIGLFMVALMTFGATGWYRRI